MRGFVRLAGRARWQLWLAAYGSAYLLVKSRAPGVAHWLDRHDIWGDMWFLVLTVVAFAIGVTLTWLYALVRWAASDPRDE